ncbi:MAG: cation diffusion facilitator family transporter [Alphaproteobacteria bacterium]|nr:cation diffusion facilitator family transporter [Alphaproteobacteria bacterium]
MTHSPLQARLIRWATYASVTLAMLMIIGKLFAWIMSDSLTVLTSLIDSVFDVVTSVVNALAAHYALRPADNDHRFGHGKAEDLAALVQSGFIIGSSFFVGVESFHRFFQPVAIHYEGMALIVMIFATAFTLGLVIFQRYVTRVTHSKVVEVDSLHYFTDIIVNGLVMLTLGLSMLGVHSIVDVIVSLIIIVYITYSAWGIGKRAFDNLMDKELPDEERRKIMEEIISIPGVRGVHDLRTRFAGITPFIQFHLELEGTLSLIDAHVIGDAVEARVLSLYPRAEVLIHHDPEQPEPLPPQLEQVKSMNYPG